MALGASAAAVPALAPSPAHGVPGPLTPASLLHPSNGSNIIGVGTISTLPSTAEVGVAAQFGVNPGGGSRPYTYTWTSDLPGWSPPGNVSEASETPTASGSFTLMVNVTDGAGDWGNTTQRLSVDPALSIGTLGVDPSSVTSGNSVTYSLSVSGGVAPYSYAWSGLPGSCPSTSVPPFSCASSGQGTLTVSVNVTDADGAQKQATSSLTVTSSSGNNDNNNGCTSNCNGSSDSSSSNNSNNGSGGFSLSSLGHLLTYALIAGFIVFVLLVITAVSTLATAILLARRLPPRGSGTAPGGTISCAACRASSPADAKFCPQCGANPKTGQTAPPAGPTS